MSAAFRLAHPNTNFGMTEVKVGLIPGAGGSQIAAACWRGTSAEDD